MLRLKIKAGALQVTVFIGIVIALLLTAFILLVHTHKQFDIRLDFSVETAKNADQGINYGLLNDVQLNKSISIKTLDEAYKSIEVKRDFWGSFERITSVSKIKNYRVVKSVLIGGVSEPQDRPALYVQDNNKPLVLVGETRIDGLTYLSKQGVKSGTISGQSYYGSQLIYGTTRRAKALPKIFYEMSLHIALIDQSISEYKEEQFLSIVSGQSYSNSFFEPTQVVFSHSDIHLNHLNLTGNIIVQSSTKISIEASSILKDVILIAPEIEIQNYVKGNFQALASNELILGENVMLDYPSALIIKEKVKQSKINKSQDDYRCRVVIGSNCEVKGQVIFLGLPQSNNYEVQLELKENTIITGEVYCNQNLELKGSVFGSVYANNFIAKQAGSIYQNHIYNGKIIANKLPKEYVGLSFNDSKKGIAKWLY